MLTMRDIYISSKLNLLTKFTSSSRSTELKDIFSWNISQMIMKTVLISRRIVISYTIKRGIPFQFDGESMETDTTTCQKFPMEGKSL